MPILQTASLLLGMGNLGLNLLNYLALTQSSAPISTGIQPSYTPQFLGGQCTGVTYNIFITARQDGGFWGNYTLNNVSGKLSEVQRRAAPDGTTIIFILGNGIERSVNPLIPFARSSFIVTNVTRTDGTPMPDNCGNLPNPNPAISNPDAGYQDSPSAPAGDTIIINRTTEAPIIPASPAPLVPSFLSGLLALLAAAVNIAELALALKNLIEQIFALLKMILDFLREFEKLLPRGKSIVSKELGAISRDGFLRLYPIDRSKHLAVSLDVRFTSLPLWRKDAILSLRSPTYYHDLGRILFVSDTMGIIKEIELHYSINSIPIPENALGFYYHLGLDGACIANTTCFYSRSN